MKRILSKILIYLLLPFLCMSQVHYETIDLDDLIRSSSHIVLVRASDPPYSVRKVKIDSRLLKELGIQTKPKNKIPDFERRIYRYEVLETYKGNVETKTIEVLPANYEDSLELHILYYGIGLSKSPIYPAYRSSLSEEPNPENQNFILFLSVFHRTGEFEMSAIGGIESADKKEEILNKIGKR
ncbi:hypothetical protein EHQ05_01740 [Leptospira yasudae]|uniref:Uncharacterized protein n=1 Tax=Leptospira yasudae TaxID=2202201 RepID=A0ABX9M6U4_9LEPT|nr:hypothetical protein [Leptospira yasudae]RHX81560.1 hypothetical protein DLM77_05615 [Leptospira yasudae]TGK29712.1 hypothetical protein EHQ05_01740 [Leptospira yasudae]TGM07663.1 hypothetical protein EHQ86_06275 [Leptospira yasudae]